jgi:DNA repair protein RecO (recombination protein O)
MQKYTAIILSSRDTNEFDRIYIMYTLEKGLVRAVAKGVRKPAARLAGHLEPGTLSEVYIARAKGLGQITSAVEVKDHKNIKSSYLKLKLVFPVLNFFSRKFSEEEKDEKTFKLLSDFLELLDKRSNLEESDKILSLSFWWKLFDALGHRPEVMRCVNCENALTETGHKFFSIQKGGIICAGCSGGEENILGVSLNNIKLIRVFLANPINKISKIKAEKNDIQNLERITSLFLKYNCL